MDEREDESLRLHWDGIFDFLRKKLDSNALVHCVDGISRSGTVVVAYMMKYFGMKFSDALTFVCARRSVISPHSGFRQQLHEYEAELRLSKFLSDVVSQRVLFEPDDASRLRRAALWHVMFQRLDTARRSQPPRSKSASPLKLSIIDTSSGPSETALSTLDDSAPVLISRENPMWLCSNFLTQQDCEILIDYALKQHEITGMPSTWSPDATHRCGTKMTVSNMHVETHATPEIARVFSRLRTKADSLFHIDATGEYAKLSRCQISFTPPEPSCIPKNSPSIGLHVDQNNGNTSRWATVLVYLNSLTEECGGATVWPCAGDATKDDVVHAGVELLQTGFTSTSEACSIDVQDGEVEVSMVDGTDAASRLLADIAPNPLKSTQPICTSGIALTPCAGTAVCFYSTDRYGTPDPRSWHGKHYFVSFHGACIVCVDATQSRYPSKRSTRCPVHLSPPGHFYCRLRGDSV